VAVDNYGKVGSISITPDRQVINVTPDGNVKFSQIGKIPKFNEIKQILTKSAMRFPYHRRLGFDVVVDKNGKVFIIEVNVNRLGFNISQYLSGGLFKEYTDEVIEYSKENKSRIHFPFTE
jgi:glutathione synthase/RimK-type ligase-like ATP-grasp enzyme